MFSYVQYCASFGSRYKKQMSKMMSFVATLSRTKDVTHLLHLGEGGGKKGEKKEQE